MPADLGQLRFYIDESVLGLGKALTIARRDVIHPGHPLLPSLPTGTLDTVWIPEVARLGLVVIARDRHVRTKPGERVILSSAGLRVFWIAGKRDLTTWGYLVRIVGAWEEIENCLATRGPGPWFMAVNETSLREIPITPAS